MNKNLVIITMLLSVLAFGATLAGAQINIKLPDFKIKKPDTTKIKETTNNNNNVNNNNNNNNVNTRGRSQIYPWRGPTGVPVFMRNSIDIETSVRDEYWKAPGQSNYSSWVPNIRFSQFYNNDKELNYSVEYTNPDGSAWFTEKLEWWGRNADRTILYKSVAPSPYFDTKSTNGTGVYGFKIINDATKEVLFQGKFKVGKFSRAYRPEEKNKNDFYVDHDWTLPYATLGFHHAFDESGAMPVLVDVWLKGAVESSELEGRVFYKGRQIASTKDAEGGGVGSVEERASGFAAAFTPDKVWKRWEFQWSNFRVDNNGTYNPEDFQRAHMADKNPGDYTVKIYRNGTQIREVSFTVGADGRFVAPNYSSQIPLPYYRLILPVKFTAPEKWDAAGWKTDAFYGNPLSGFAMQ